MGEVGIHWLVGDKVHMSKGPDWKKRPQTVQIQRNNEMNQSIFDFIITFVTKGGNFAIYFLSTQIFFGN